MIFLSTDELRELTGYSYRSHQISWLRKHNWKFELTGQHRPKVARAYFEMRMLGHVLDSINVAANEVARPNFNALGRLLKK